MRAEHVKKAIKNNDYVLFNHIEYGYFGINCKWVQKKGFILNQKGANYYSGFKPCNIAEYINYKAKLK